MNNHTSAIIGCGVRREMDTYIAHEIFHSLVMLVSYRIIHWRG